MSDTRDEPFDRLSPVANRRAGVEIEFAGLREQAVAEIVRARLGGHPSAPGPHTITLEDTAIGAVKIVLDTAYRDTKGSDLADALLEIGRGVIPVEIVTEPLSHDALQRLGPLIDDLRASGARGTRGGVLLGFGLHFNIAVAAETAAAIVPVVRAFALIEDWLRKSRPIDLSRRILPFVDPYPRRLVDRLAAEAPGWSMTAFIDAYLAESPSRNRGLDLLPLLRHLDAARVTAALANSGSVKPRPAFHYRLPDCRIDEPDWSLAREWNRWCLVERVAADRVLLTELAAAWRAHRGALTTLRTDWPVTVDAILAERPETLNVA